MNAKCGLSAALVLGAVAMQARAQDAVPTEILTRTVPIQAGDEDATGFFLDSAGEMYLVTAWHVVKDLPCNPEIKVWISNEWTILRPKRILTPPSDADIAVLDTGFSAEKPYAIIPEQYNSGPNDGPTFGQQVWFLGYPFWSDQHPHGLSTEAPKPLNLLPFIRHGTLSAMDSTNPKAIVLYIDGINNHGFSGGPIVYWSFSAHTYRILGVTQGYLPEDFPQEWTLNGQKVTADVLANSGIVIGYSIKHATDVIKAGAPLGQCKK